ncbi:MAG TPA: DUF4080 domain-containing protein [Candidatus Phocaeicola caecigallinarum]|nr:DUF4080 domain-containing protein [Candidatus Phocaeicola caecigallinarum]
MKILWLDLNSSYAHSSLALPALQAQLIGHADIEWDIVSATINENPGMASAEVFRRKPDIVAATCWLFNHEMLLHTLGRIKALLPDCCITLGGPEFLGDNERFLRNYPFVNCVFRGEGEEVFARWLEIWNKPEAWHTITGLCYLDTVSTYHDNGRAQVMHFDRLVPPEESPFFNWSKPFVQLETTRGCFNTCAFCVSGGEKPVRTLPIETIRRRISLIQEHHIRNIRVLDRTFNYNTRHARALLDLFREFPDIRFHLEVHPALLSEELKEILASMPKGQLHLEAGIQSLHQEVLAVSRRAGDLADALSGLEFLCALPNLETHADLIAGLPLYHLKEIFEDVRTLASYRAGEIQLESLKLLPGTEMRRRSPELSISYSPFPPYEVLKTNEITPDELQTARMLSRLIDGFYNAKPWQEITRRLIVEESEFLHRFLEHLTRIGVIDQPMSLERRGILLYKFCQENYPTYETAMTLAWIEAGMSLKKEPAYRVRTKHVLPPEHWEVLNGTYHEELRLCLLPPAENEDITYWFGFEPESQQTKPVFKARTL